MNSNRIPLSSPHMGGSEQKYITETLASNWVTSLGPNLALFEERLEDYLGSGAVAALNSGTSAIHLGLILLGVQAGDEVLCQTMTFSASANPILYQGATPIFIDSEPDTWNLCPVALEEAIQDRIAKGLTPKAIIAVHLYGVPYQVNKIRAIADKYEIPILEDAAEALGSSYKGQKCGTFGDIGILSFNGNKIITTSGGGALVTASKEMQERAVPRHDYEIVDASGNAIGIVTSGTMSPSMNKGIGLGYVTTEHSAVDSDIYIRIRKNDVPAKVVKLPFYKK